MDFVFLLLPALLVGFAYTRPLNAGEGADHAAKPRSVCESC